MDGVRDQLLIKVGTREVLRLGPADVVASGLAPEVYAEAIRARLQSFLRAKRRRRATRPCELVLSISPRGPPSGSSPRSLAMRWINDQRQHLRRWIARTAQTDRGQRARNMLVLSREGFESVAFVLATFTALAAQLALLLSYVVFVLSQFEATRGWIPPLLNILFSPFADLLQRFAHLLPSVVVLIAAFYVVLGGVRLLRFFLQRVASGRLTVSWLPADLAAPLRPLFEGAVVLLALLVVSPLIAGSHADLLSRIGLLLVGALLLAGLPVGATLLAGAFSVVSRRYVVGQWLEVGKHFGELTEVTFFELRLVPVDAGMIRIPHLVALWVPVRQLPGPPLLEIDLPLSPAVDPSVAMEAIARAVPESFGKPEVTLRSLDGAAAVYSLRLPPLHLGRRAELLVLVAAGLTRAGLALASTPTVQPNKS